MNTKEARDLAGRVWSMDPPANKKVGWALLEACDSLEKLQIDVDNYKHIAQEAVDKWKTENERVTELEGSILRIKCALVAAGVHPNMVNAIERGGEQPNG